MNISQLSTPQDSEYLKRKFRQGWHLLNRLQPLVLFYEMERDSATTDQEKVAMHNRMSRMMNRYRIINRYIDRLTAPDAGVPVDGAGV